MEKDIPYANFWANILVHEFEALLFSDTAAFSAVYGEQVMAMLDAIRRQFASPEHINGGKTTAPSKRILSICDGYRKVPYGTLIAKKIGLDRIRKECLLFDAWVTRIEQLVADEADS